MTQTETGRPRGSLDPLVAPVRRLLPLARFLGRLARRLAYVSLGATVVIAAAAFHDGVPDAASLVASIVLLLIVAAPAVVLLSFWFLLREAVEVPDRIGRLPESARDRAVEAAQLLSDASGPDRSAWRRWRLLRRLRAQIQASRELLAPWAPLVPLLSVPYLLVVLAAAIASVLEAFVALIVVLVLAL